jgi:hypothetical protein
MCHFHEKFSCSVCKFLLSKYHYPPFFFPIHLMRIFYRLPVKWFQNISHPCILKLSMYSEICIWCATVSVCLKGEENSCKKY